MQGVLVIDMLEDFFRDGPLAESRTALCTRINTLTAWARDRGLPVIWVRQAFRDDLSDAYLVMKKRNIRITIENTPGCEILVELRRDDEEPVIVKKRYSPFHATGLDELLARLGISALVLAGVNTHACVRMAAVDAYQRDLEVIVPRDCVDSYDAVHHQVTLDYLGRGIAQIVTLADLTGGAAS